MSCNDHSLELQPGRELMWHSHLSPPRLFLRKTFSFFSIQLCWIIDSNQNKKQRKIIVFSENNFHINPLLAWWQLSKLSSLQKFPKSQSVMCFAKVKKFLQFLKFSEESQNVLFLTLLKNIDLGYSRAESIYIKVP